MAIQNWGELITALNPLSFISDMYANTLNYKLETKRISAEIEQMRLQSDLLHKKIDCEYQMRMEFLLQRRTALEAALKMAEKNMKQLRIERKEVLRMAASAQEQSFRKDLDPEQMRFYADMSIAMVEQLHVFGNRASESLQSLIHALPSSDIPLMLEASN